MDLNEIIEYTTTKIPIFSTINIFNFDIPWFVNFTDMYTLNRQLGMGGSGFVKAYTENQTGNVYAVKEISILGNEDINFYNSLFSEIEVLKDLTINHPSPSILKYHDSFMYVDPDGSRYYMIITEYIEGFSLEEVPYKDVELLTHVILPIGYWLFDTLDYIHRLGYVHRDIKPHNIMLDTVNNRFVLIDFGLTCCIYKHNSDVLSCQDSNFMGTLRFMPPEVLENHDNKISKPSRLERIKSVDPIKMIGLNRIKSTDIASTITEISTKNQKLEFYKAIDIWAAGITLYFLIENTLPWDSQFDFKVREQIIGPYEIPYNKSKSIKYILNLCLQRDPSSRSDAASIRTLIANVIADSRSLSTF